MSNFVAYNAQGRPVTDYSSLYKPTTNVGQHAKAPNTMPKALPVETPVGLSSVHPTTYSNNVGQSVPWVDPNMYGPQKNLQNQLQQRYMQIQSEPKQNSYIAYSGAIQNYASWN